MQAPKAAPKRTFPNIALVLCSHVRCHRLSVPISLPLSLFRCFSLSVSELQLEPDTENCILMMGHSVANKENTKKMLIKRHTQHTDTLVRCNCIMKLQLALAAQRHFLGRASGAAEGAGAGVVGAEAHPLASIRVSWHAICVVLLQCLVHSLYSLHALTPVAHSLSSDPSLKCALDWLYIYVCLRVCVCVCLCGLWTVSEVHLFVHCCNRNYC